MPTLLAVHNYYYYRGGAETLFLEHNRLLEQQGWEVVPFAMRHERNLPSPWSEFFVDEIEFGRNYSLIQKLSRVPKVIYSVEARRNLARLLDTIEPDLCHVHNVYHHISPSILGLLKQRRIPTVLTLHDLKLACPAYYMLSNGTVCEKCRGGRTYNVLLNRCIKGSVSLSAVVFAEAVLHRLLGTYRNCVDRFIVPSRFYIDKFEQWGMPRTLFRYIPNFVDVPRYSPRFAPGSYFLFFGRLSPEKGVSTLIRAAAQCGQPLMVTGTGPEEQALRELAAGCGAPVQFSGYKSGDALHDVVRGARAIVLPSEWYENAPMSVLEAYALGKPVIGARIGGIPELILEGETGYSFESGNVDSLAASLRAMSALNDGEIEQMGRRGRAWVEQNFSAQMYRDRILGIYQELGATAVPALSAC